MQSISVYLDIANVTDTRWKNANVSKTAGVCHMMSRIFFGSLLGKV